MSEVILGYFGLWQLMLSLSLIVIGLLGLVWRRAVFYQARPRQKDDWEEADEQSQRLFEEVFGTEKLQELKSRGWLDIPSSLYPNRQYRVSGNGYSMVRVYENGKVVMSLCLQPTEWVPGPDVVLMHWLMIKADELAYLKQANQFEPDYPYYLRWNEKWQPV